MFSKVSEKIIDNFVKDGIVDFDEKELYQYGIKHGLLIILNIATTLFIGFLLGMVWHMIVFLLAFIPLRTYAGGYHAKTPFRCYIFSAILITIALLAMKFVFLNPYVLIAALLLVGIVIMMLAPVEDKNKPLDEVETRVYRKRAVSVWALEFLFGILLIIVKLNFLAECIFWAMVMICFLMIVGKLKNH